MNFGIIPQRLRKKGGQGGHGPPWNFQDHVFLPNFAPRKVENQGFSLCLAPPRFQSLRKRCAMGEDKAHLRISVISIEKLRSSTTDMIAGKVITHKFVDSKFQIKPILLNFLLG